MLRKMSNSSSDCGEQTTWALGMAVKELFICISYLFRMVRHVIMRNKSCDYESQSGAGKV